MRILIDVEVNGSEIREFDCAICVDEDVAAFEISMQDLIRVEEDESLEDLLRVDRSHLLIELTELIEHLADGPA